MMKLIKPLFIIMIAVILILIINTIYSRNLNQTCYEKCSELHLMGVASNWDYSDYVIIQSDTIWVDRECYDFWCICIDECDPGLCCDLLK